MFSSQEDVPPGDSHSVPNKPAKSLANMKPTDPYTGQMQYPIGKKDPEAGFPDISTENCVLDILF